MERIIEEDMNSILNENDYPDLETRVGIDVGASAVIQYGRKTNYYTKTERKDTKKT